MDNFRIDVIAEGCVTLEAALEIAFRHNGGPTAVGYRVHPEKGLVFVWSMGDHRDPGVVAFPFKMDVKGAADFAQRWLAEQNYGRQPDHDGDNGKGWRVYCEGWGRVGDISFAICAVQPQWAMYGK